LLDFTEGDKNRTTECLNIGNTLLW